MVRLPIRLATLLRGHRGHLGTPGTEHYPDPNILLIPRFTRHLILTYPLKTLSTKEELSETSKSRPREYILASTLPDGVIRAL